MYATTQARRPGAVVSTADIGACWANFHGWFNLACTSNTQNANNGGSGVYANSFSSLGLM